MADAELRELERAFAASGAVDDEARLLQALVRAGRLDPERVRLAATLGDEAARRVSPVEPAPSLRAWIDRAVSSHWPVAAAGTPLGWQVAVRLALAAAHALRASLSPFGAGSDEALRAAEDWCLCPCLACARRAAEQTGDLPGLTWAYDVAAWLAAGGGVDRRSLRPADLSTPLAEVCGAWARDLGGADRAQARLMAELVPWALGRGDAVRARVEERHGR